jgi:hypothetical protein
MGACRQLRGAQVAIVEQDGFLAGYLHAALEREGATVIETRGTVEHIVASLRKTEPPPVVAAIDIELSGSPELTAVLVQLDVPFVLVARDKFGQPARSAFGRRFWRWPFGAFQVLEALDDLLAERRALLRP